MKAAFTLAVLVAQALAVGADPTCWTSSATPTTAITSGASPTIACYHGADKNVTLGSASAEGVCWTLKVICGPLNATTMNSSPNECLIDAPGSVHYRYFGGGIPECKLMYALLSVYNAIGGVNTDSLTACNSGSGCNAPVALPATTNYTGSFSVSGVTPAQMMTADSAGQLELALITLLGLGSSFPITLSYSNATANATGRHLLTASSTTVTYTLPLQPGSVSAVTTAAAAITPAALNSTIVTTLGLSTASVSSVTTTLAAGPSSASAAASAGSLFKPAAGLLLACVMALWV